MERWLPIPGFEGRYSVSDLGRVRSETRLVKSGQIYIERKGKLLSIQQHARSDNGYPKVTMSDFSRRVKRMVHHLVTEAFLGPCPDGHQRCHNDGDKSNNRLTNLRYDTPAGNTRDAIRLGQMALVPGERHPMAKFSDQQVDAIRRDSRPYREIAAEFGVSRSHISTIKHFRTRSKSPSGATWREYTIQKGKK